MTTQSKFIRSIECRILRIWIDPPGIFLDDAPLESYPAQSVMYTVEPTSPRIGISKDRLIAREASLVNPGTIHIFPARPGTRAELYIYEGNEVTVVAPAEMIYFEDCAGNAQANSSVATMLKELAFQVAEIGGSNAVQS